jgi:hypothetical protein
VQANRTIEKVPKRTYSCTKDKPIRQSLPTRRITFLRNEGKNLSLKRKPNESQKDLAKIEPP